MQSPIVSLPTKFVHNATSGWSKHALELLDQSEPKKRPECMSATERPVEAYNEVPDLIWGQADLRFVGKCAETAHVWGTEQQTLCRPAISLA